MQHVVEVTNSAAAAIEKIQHNNYALILSDYKLGQEQTGLDVLFKAKEKDPNVITILMTGYGTDQLAVRAVAEGVYDYLTKPFNNVLQIRNVVARGVKYYELLRKYNEKLADEAMQKELLEETLEKARRTREILRMIAAKRNNI